MRKSLASLVVLNFVKNISVTTWLIIANVLFFILFYLLVLVNPAFMSYIALKPSGLVHGKIWLLLTSMFMHAGIGHLFVNMFSLAFVGNFLERVIGRKRFFWFYIISGVVAGIFYCILALAFGNYLPGVFGSAETSAVGASGALFGLLGVLAVLTPRARVYLIVGPLIAIILQSVLEMITNNSFSTIFSYIVSFYFLLSLFSMMSFDRRLVRIALPVEMPFWLLPILAIVPLVFVSLFVNLPIGNTAHLGGLIAGIAFGWYLRRKYKKKIALLNRMVR